MNSSTSRCGCLPFFDFGVTNGSSLRKRPSVLRNFSFCWASVSGLDRLTAFRASLRATCSASAVAFFLASLALRFSRFVISAGPSSSGSGVTETLLSGAGKGSSREFAGRRPFRFFFDPRRQPRSMTIDDWTYLPVLRDSSISGSSSSSADFSESSVPGVSSRGVTWSFSSKAASSICISFLSLAVSQLRFVTYFQTACLCFLLLS